MAYTITKSGPYFSSGEIKFSDLRTYFKEASSGTLNATELRRNTTTSNTAPIVPDCTENRTSGPLAGGISTLNDLRISQFRNSIKYYNVTQTGTNDNGANTGLPGCNVSGDINWNSNLQYNIIKQFNINGTIGSYSTLQYATALNSATYNLYINVNGTVQGASGPGSTNQSLRTGNNGGPAMYINPGTSGSVWVNVNSSGTILGGGGGGAMGITGANGSAGTCVNQYETGSRCGGGPGCPAPYTNIGNRNTGCCAGQCGSPCWRCCFQCRSDGYTSNCNWTRTVAGAPGGRGGYGGRGIGYTLAQQNGFVAPNYGEAAGPVYGGCPSYGPRTAGDGLRGQTGGNGATAWGGAGNGTTSASGGIAGRGITGGGAGYVVNDTGYTSNIKGGY